MTSLYTVRNRFPRKRSPDAILADLFNPLDPKEASVMTQIILRDLDPILYPVPSTSADASLLQFNSAAYHQITAFDAMRRWHVGMPRLYKVSADLDYISDVVEVSLSENSDATMRGREGRG